MTRPDTTVVPAEQLTLAHTIVAGQYQIRPRAIERGPDGTVVVHGNRTRLGSAPGTSVSEPTTKTYGRGQGATVLSDGPDRVERVALELRVDRFDGRTLTERGNYPARSRIGRLFYGQGRAERVVVHEATGDTRTYTYLSDDDREDPFDAFARGDLEDRGVDPETAREVVAGTYGVDDR